MSAIQSNVISPSLLAAVNPATATTSGTAASVADTQNRFMTLLVTQMKNQDPLNPMDNSQVTSQLAQLSTVSGIGQLNTTLQALQGSYQASQTLQATSMIGHGVLTAGSSVDLVSGKAILGVDLSNPADSVQFTIQDASGNPIRTMSLGATDAGTMPLAWDGLTDSGATAPDGKYTFKVNATSGGKNVDGVTALAFGQVASVSTGAHGVKLNVPGIGAVDLSDIKQIL